VSVYIRFHQSEQFKESEDGAPEEMGDDEKEEDDDDVISIFTLDYLVKKQRVEGIPLSEDDLLELKEMPLPPSIFQAAFSLQIPRHPFFYSIHVKVPPFVEANSFFDLEYSINRRENMLFRRLLEDQDVFCHLADSNVWVVHGFTRKKLPFFVNCSNYLLSVRLLCLVSGKHSLPQLVLEDIPSQFIIDESDSVLVNVISSTTMLE
jgi:hypothetical protein